MKRRIGILLGLLLIMICAFASADVEIGEAAFPDANFRKVIADSGFDEDGNGILDDTELGDVAEITCDGCSIADLTGIEYFTSLESLYCSSNRLTALDVSKNKNLVVLHCSSNQLAKLDVTANPELRYLHCNNNQLTELDVTQNPKLYELLLAGNNVREVDASGCGEDYWGLASDLRDTNPTDKGSWWLYEESGGKQIASFDKTTHVEIGNGLTIETISAAIQEQNFPDANFRFFVGRFDKDKDGVLSGWELGRVQTISCAKNQIEDLTGIEYFPVLAELDCSINSLKTLDLSANKLLVYVDCSRNKQITALDVSNSRKLAKLNCYKNQLTDLKMDNCHLLIELNCYENQLTSLDVSGFPLITELDCDQNQLTKLDVSGNPYLTELNCSSNLLTELDTSKNTALQDLYCSSNQLTKLDIGSNPELLRLWCYSNLLTELDTGKCTKLIDTACYSNKLKKLDVSRNPELYRLLCHDNWMTALDVSMCGELVETLKTKTPSDEDSYWLYQYYGANRVSFDKTVRVNLGDSVIEPEATPTPEPTPSPTPSPTPGPTAEPTSEPTAEPTSEPTASPGPQPTDDGTFTSGGLRYRITGKSTAAFAGPAKAPGKAVVTIPATVSHAKTTYRVTEIDAKALYHNTKLKTLTIGKNVKTVGKNAFESCTLLTAVKGGSGVVTIRDNAFSGCKALKTLPVMGSLQTLGAGAFKDCVKLTGVTLGTKVKSIGKNAFSGCAKLKTITIKTTKLTAKNVGANAFKGIYGKPTVICPKGKVKAYQKLLAKKGMPKKAVYK